MTIKELIENGYRVILDTNVLLNKCKIVQSKLACFWAFLSVGK